MSELKLDHAKTLTTDQLICSKAADVLEERGWGQTSLFRGSVSDRRNFCLIGAIGQAREELGLVINFRMCDSYPEVTGHALYEKLCELLDREPWEWNDEESRTKEDVINFLRSVS